MLSRCANPQCSKRFLHLREGKLFQVETGNSGEGDEPQFGRESHERRRRPHVERYWLCDECAQVWTLVYDLSQGILLMPRPRPVEREKTRTAAVGVASM